MRYLFNSWVGKIPWRRKWQATPVLFSGESHGQRSLAGYSPWARKELGTTERLHKLILRVPPMQEMRCKKHGLDSWVRRWDVRKTGWIPGSGRSPGGGHENPTPVFLPGEFPWTEEPGGLQSIGSQRVGQDWSNLAMHLNDGESQHSDWGSLPPEPFSLAIMLSGHWEDFTKICISSFMFNLKISKRRRILKGRPRNTHNQLLKRRKGKSKQNHLSFPRNRFPDSGDDSVIPPNQKCLWALNLLVWNKGIPRGAHRKKR